MALTERLVTDTPGGCLRTRVSHERSFRKYGVPYFGVLIIRTLLFRVLYFRQPPTIRSRNNCSFSHANLQTERPPGMTNCQRPEPAHKAEGVSGIVHYNDIKEPQHTKLPTYMTNMKRQTLEREPQSDQASFSSDIQTP